MAEGDIGSVVDTLVFFGGTHTFSDIIHVTGDIYAIVFSGTDGDGFIVTVEIDSAGNIGASVIDTFEFDTSNCQFPDIIHIADDIFAIAYTGAGNHGFCVTLSISDAGDIGAAVIDSLDFDTGGSLDPNIINVSGSTYAVVYVGAGNHGKVSTFTISDAGDIGAAVIDSFEFDTVGCGNPRIIHVSGEVFAVFHAGSSYPGQISTFTINAGGDIGAATIDKAAYDTSSANFNRVLHVSGNVFAVVYRGPAYDGWLATVTISDAGDIGASAIENWEFDYWEGRHPDIMHISGDVYCIAHDSGGSAKNLITFHISDAGDINTSLIDDFDFPAPGASYCDIIYISGSIYGVVFRGNANVGTLKTLDVETILAAAARHELLMGIG